MGGKKTNSAVLKTNCEKMFSSKDIKISQEEIEALKKRKNTCNYFVVDAWSMGGKPVEKAGNESAPSRTRLCLCVFFCFFLFFFILFILVASLSFHSLFELKLGKEKKKIP